MAHGSDTREALRIRVVEDIRTLRDGFPSLIHGADGFTCAGTFRTMEDALERIGPLRTPAVLVDLGLPGMGGNEGIRILKDRYPALVLMTLPVYDDHDRIFNALCAGAFRIPVEEGAPAATAGTIREAVNEGARTSPEIACRVVEVFGEIRPPKRTDDRR